MKVRKYFKSISIGDIDYAAAFYGEGLEVHVNDLSITCLLYTSPSPRDS